MKILFATARIPYPPLKGDQVVSYHRLKVLSRKHDIDLLTFYEHDEDLSELPELLKYCRKIYTVKLPKWKSLLNILLFGLFNDTAFQILYYRSREFKKTLDSILATRRIDIAHIFLVRLAPYFRDLNIPSVLELIDSMQLNFERRVEKESGIKKMLFNEELRRISLYEKEIGNHFDCLAVVSQKDRGYIPQKNVIVLPIGVDVNDYDQFKNIHKKDRIIIFSGNMGYHPNVIAVKWFIENCLEKIAEKVPDVFFIVAGGGVSNELYELGKNDEKIAITGYIESMPDMLNYALISIAPMQSGSGVQNKILEAMSCGLPVVTTTLGLGDIGARAGKEIFVADTPEEFSARVVTLLKNRTLCGRVGERARKFVMDNYSWESAGDRLDRLYKSLIRQGGKGR